MRPSKNILGFSLLVTLASTPAFAQSTSSPASTTTYPTCSKTVASAESELAHQKYIAGKQDYDEANYDSAIRRFRDAYTLDCTKHELLIIISAAYERKGDKKEAVAALEAYVERVPNAPDVSTYQAKIENLKKQIAAAPPPPEPTPAPAEPSQPQPVAETRGHTPWPWVVVGAGVVAVSVGVVLLLTVPDLPQGCDEITERCTRLPNESQEAFEDRQSAAGRAVGQPKWGAVVLAGGGALLAGGLVWHFLEPTGPKDAAKTRLRPHVAPGYAGLSLGGSF